APYISQISFFDGIVSVDKFYQYKTMSFEVSTAGKETVVTNPLHANLFVENKLPLIDAIMKLYTGE
ncbi:MAG: hypothetical protein LBV52_03375, partial [Spirochaetaceae bacterium]|nr:hypothetical protein [Spirochaetaceae bacterium]